MNDVSRSSNQPAFLAGGGEMGMLILERDWSGSPLGPVDVWPQCLRVILGFLLRSPVVMVLLWGKDGVMLYNDAYASFAGGRHPEQLGMKVREGWPEVAAFNDHVMEVCLAGGTLHYRDQELVLDRHGRPERVWMNLDYSPVLNESGEPAGVLCVVAEITEHVAAQQRREAAEAALRAERDRAQGVLDNMGEAFVFLDREFRIVDMNTEAMRLEQRPKEAILGKTHWEVHPDAAPELGELYRQAMRERRAVSLEHHYVWPDGRHTWIDMRAHPAGNGLAVFYRDVTDRKAAEAALQESEARLSFLDRLGAETAALADADAVLATTTRLLGEHLRVSVCAYADMDEDQDGFTIRGDWAAPGSTSIVGHYSLADFGRLAVKNLGAGEPLVVNDNLRELAPEEATTFQSIGITATICMPLVKEGRLTALMAIHDKVPRAWTAEELALLQQVTARSWAHVERVGATAELRESEAQFRAFAQAVPNHAWAARSDGALYWFNDQVYAYCGEVLGSLDGTEWARIVHPDDLPCATATWAHAVSTGEVYETEFRIRRSDGHYRWFLVRAEPAHGADGAIQSWVGTNTDIDDRRRAEAELRELNADLERQVVERTRERTVTWEVTPDLMGALDPEGYFKTSNPAWQTLLGWTEEEVASQSIWELLHPDDLERTRGGFALTQIGTPAIRFPNRYRAKDGSYRWISWVGVPVDGMVYCTGRDITVEKEQEAELAQRTAERDRLWRNTQDIQIVIDEAGVFQAVNPAFTQILGWAPEQVVGRSVFEFIVPEDDALSNAALEHARQETLPVVENRYRHKDGGFRWISWVAAPEGGLIYASGRHITEQKAQAEALAQAETALRQSQKMEAVGQLTGGLAHDFNNLLAGVSGSLELMATRITQGRLSDVDRYLVAAQGATRRAAALTHRLLAFSRRQTLAPKVTDVNALVTGMEELIRRTVGPEVVVERVTGSGIWAVEIDPNQLENALLNLAINARDAMPDGGKITIETANRWMDARAAREQEIRPGQYVSLSVSDTGTGMAKDVIAKAFDPFFTTKPIGQGTGLGLSMVYGFARQSGGQVRIYSEVGQGTMVCLYLPRHLGEAEDSERDGGDEPAAAPARAGETVLVIDDEPVVRMLIVDVLEELGYAALEASDGPEGLKVLQSKARVDLLITDVGLPGGLNGRQVADAARSLRPDLKVLFITGYAENAVINHGHLEPGMQVLTKPFAVDDLTRRIRGILSDG